MNFQHETFRFRLLTPCFAGTAVGHKNPSTDLAEMRVPPIRGHIRGWHRKLYGNADCNRVWGSAAGDDGTASRVALQLEQTGRPSTQKERLLPHADARSRNNFEKRKAESKAAALPTGSEFSLRLTRLPGCNSQQWEHAQVAIKLWLLLGTLGLRSSRAAGSLWPEGDWVPGDIEGLGRFLRSVGFQEHVRVAGLGKHKTADELRTTASDTLDGQREIFGGIRPRKPSPTKFKVGRLVEEHVLLVTGPRLDRAWEALRNKPRWQALGDWRAVVP